MIDLNNEPLNDDELYHAREIQKALVAAQFAINMARLDLTDLQLSRAVNKISRSINEARDLIDSI